MKLDMSSRNSLLTIHYKHEQRLFKMAAKYFIIRNKRNRVLVQLSECQKEIEFQSFKSILCSSQAALEQHVDTVNFDSMHEQLSNLESLLKEVTLHLANIEAEVIEFEAETEGALVLKSKILEYLRFTPEYQEDSVDDLDQVINNCIRNRMKLSRRNKAANLA
ncbi:hypothetical protein [Thioclava kandeliae]|uniref:Uncharacterized protein n=1 Tax=Thioclava kandeliae TaxID=3070818 RepID=A0ABV1SM30_9RHOB